MTEGPEQWLTTLIHELRNPMAAMRGAVDLLDLAPLDPRARRAQQVLDRQVSRLNAVLDDLLAGIEGRHRRAPAAEVAQAAPPPAAPAPGQRRILVVEDNPDVAEVTAELLSLDGQLVTVATTGVDALAAFDRLHPEIVLLDLGLPDMTGYDLARVLRARPAGAEAVLVSISGWGGPEVEARAAEAGIDRHLTKPVTRAQLSRLSRGSAPEGAR